MPRDQAREMYEDVCRHPGSTTEEIIARTGWHAHVVRLALALMLRAHLVRIDNLTSPEPAVRWAAREGH